MEDKNEEKKNQQKIGSQQKDHCRPEQPRDEIPERW
jgi:hypothetical protein